MASEEPRLLGGRYELGLELGYGGMAEVYAARDTRLGREVAIKVLRSDLARDPAFLGRFRREAQSAASLNHPNIVAVYDTGDDVSADGREHRPYIVMEYVAGRTLREVLAEDGRLLPRRAMELVAEVASALEYSHRAGIVHRDIKPGNVMLTPTGEVKVMDFGIARAVSATSSTMTQTAQVLGTAQYLSPEQARGEHVDARSDIYSAGCLLYELLTGVPPFQGESAVAVAYQHVREDPLPPSQIDRDLPSTVDAVVLKAMAKNPANRYQDAGEFRADLRRAAAGQRVEAPSVLARDTTMALPPASATTVLLRQDEDDRRGRRTAAYIALLVAVIAVLVAAAFLAKDVLFSGGSSTVVVPNLYGKTVAQATAILKTDTLQVGKVTPVTKGSAGNTLAPGLIFRQDPIAQATTKKNTKVDLLVSSSAKQTTIPSNLLGMSLNDAENALTQAGLKVGKITPASSSQPTNTVLASNPEPGKTVAQGAAVALTVASGSQDVPDVTGQPLTAATNTLEKAGFVVASPQTQASDTVPDGDVISQSISGSAPVGSTVTLVVSSGPAAPTSSAPPITSASTPATTATSPATPTATSTPATHTTSGAH